MCRIMSQVLISLSHLVLCIDVHAYIVTYVEACVSIPEQGSGPGMGLHQDQSEQTNFQGN
jgi:hypothetical protein